MEIDFDKQCNNIIENCEQIENEMENLETDCKKLHQRIEEYRSSILEAGVDPLTKRIPASKYKRFVKQQYLMNATIINGYNLKLANVVKERKLSEKVLKKVTEQVNNVSEIDQKHLELKYNKLYHEVVEIHELEKTMRARRSKYPNPHILLHMCRV
uniref:Uncharacterized protein n=1 Tax=Sipha flava TaxID=143950 RepID=A0A2S2QLB6_9HEMI